MPISFKMQRIYPADESVLQWRGTHITDPEEFALFLQGPVKERVGDETFAAEFKHDLSALATTDMASETLEKLLTSAPVALDWEIGEAISECLLADEFGAEWPWNENRDRKTPRASLPGADIVGFLEDDDGTALLFGEVKTSSDSSAPPGVLNGRSGLIHQIDALATRTDIHFALLKWLSARCKGGPLWGKFQQASQRYLNSGGKDMALVGVLLRDTPPDVEDLRTRGEKLVASAAEKPRIRLDAWYTPMPIVSWVELVQG